MTLTNIIEEYKNDFWIQFKGIQRIWSILLEDDFVPQIRAQADAAIFINELVSIGQAFNPKKINFYTYDWHKNHVLKHVEYLIQEEIVSYKVLSRIKSVFKEYEKKCPDEYWPFGHFEALPTGVKYYLESNRECIDFLDLLKKYHDTQDISNIEADFSKLKSFKSSSKFSQIFMLANPYVFPVVNSWTDTFFRELFGYDVRTRGGYLSLIPSILEWCDIAGIPDMEVLDSTAEKISSMANSKSKADKKRYTSILSEAKKFLADIAKGSRKAKGIAGGGGEGLLHKSICQYINDNPTAINKNAKRLKNNKSSNFELLSFHRPDVVLRSKNTYWIIEVKPKADETLGGLSQVLGYAAELKFLKRKVNQLVIKPVLALPQKEFKILNKSILAIGRKYGIRTVGIDI